MWEDNRLIKVPLNDPYPVWSHGVKLDDLLKNQGRIDFIKMDIDGSEVKALRGMTKIFKKNPQLKMVIEFSPESIELAGDNPQEYLDILNKYFTVFRIEGDYGNNLWNLYCERKIT
jgi:hypothetical protein